MALKLPPGACDGQIHVFADATKYPPHHPKPLYSPPPGEGTIEKALADAAREGVRDSYAMQQVIRRTIGTWVSRAHRRRPMIIPVVVRG